MSDKCLHIIHLPCRKDRWQLLQQELSIQQINQYRIWPGIIDEASPRHGILRAHQQIVSWADQQGLTEVCIAEDDVQVSSSGAFDYFRSQKPMDFDLYLGGITWGIFESDHTVRDFSGTMLYMVHERFYETILNLCEAKDFDRMMAGLGHLWCAILWLLVNMMDLVITYTDSSILNRFGKKQIGSGNEIIDLIQDK